MSNLMKRWTARRTRRREAGATAVEYALMASFIALVIIAAVIVLGQNLNGIFLDASTRL